MCESATGIVTILYKGKPLPYTIYNKQVHQAEFVDTKTLDRQIKLPQPPAPNHPWKQYGQHISGKPIQEAHTHGTD